jgi:hypothetical protein
MFDSFREALAHRKQRLCLLFNSSYSVGSDMGARTVAIDGRPIDLTDLEYLLFLTLAGRPLPE